jgi:hypothetical protein
MDAGAKNALAIALLLGHLALSDHCYMDYLSPWLVDHGAQWSVANQRVKIRTNVVADTGRPLARA